MLDCRLEGGGFAPGCGMVVSKLDIRDLDLEIVDCCDRK